MNGGKASVSIDLDPVRCYGAIHGLQAPRPASPREDAIYARGLPRHRALLDALGIRATFFVVARDATDPWLASVLRTLVADGHEVASHSLDHRYDLVRLPAAEMAEQVDGAVAALEEAVGVRPRGFRAPGYTVSDDLLATVARSGASYDASVLPCPAYFAAKAVAVGAMRLLGRRSASIVDSPRVLTAPVEPYRIGVPYTHAGAGLREIPVGVTPHGRLPFLGTLLVLAGPRVARTIAAAMRPRGLASLELHGIDLCDAAGDGLCALAGRQPDLRVGLERKRASLEAALRQLAADGRRFVRLDEVV